MSRRVVEVTTGSRLHFGLMSFGRGGVRQFGGVGAMIEEPALKLRLASAEELTVTGPAADLVRAHVEAVAQAEWFGRRPTCCIEVHAAPTAHVGLGSGTQLALGVVAGLNELYDRAPLSPTQLAQTVGRGRRSAIGLYGFLQGGLIAEAGKLTEEEISPLVSRVEIPREWRFLLVRSDDSEGLSGDAERQAFARVPLVSAEATARMCRAAMLGLLPAAVQNQHEQFSQSLYEFGQEAGACFAPLQGGIYASKRAAKIVQTLRDLRITGVGQSSWGPTVFAVLDSQRAAESVVERLRSSTPFRDATCVISPPRNEGARIEVWQE